MANIKEVKFLSFKSVILTLIIVTVASVLVLYPKYQKNKDVSPDELLSKSISPERYISTDEVAQLIINQDPSYLFIDVRDSSEFQRYSLPNAVNIPLKNLLDEEYESYLNQDNYDVIIFSNDHFKADGAWMICNRLKYKNLRVLEGGLNQWFKTILNPIKPSENMAAEDFNLYSKRKAASMYFGVSYPERERKQPVNYKPAAKKVVLSKKKKHNQPEGGC